ncbi:DUF4386 domain-containing protein [Saccharospirillum salsuginis]|uniref:DUF4386 domain-containing protein n=1 Tax=Saccharospirillum salsuginis TaxID=418750 RepID=A0A918NKD2_9GAMM|nr:DUF4386 domain-containing protein [Saccharospirillum salsuginis]GGX75015.1 DUF4386 domain-containing protein [Saccharospirillum salsuginis]
MTHTALTSHQRKAARVAGVALLLMALLAPIAFFTVLEPIRTAGDAAAQVNALRASGTMFQVSIVIFLTVAVLDVLVAWALHGIFSREQSQLSLLTAWFRLVYTALLLVATASLIDAQTLLQSPVQGSPHWNLLLQHDLNRFFTTFNFGLGVFGCHLVCLGYLMMRARLFPGFLGALIVIAGLGYLADTLGTLMIPQYDLNVASVTFIGEVLLIGWLIWFGWKRPGRGAETHPSY